MEVIEKKISELKPYKRNPRKNDAAVDVVANSIREFGFKVPIVIDAKDEIICGHTRLKAAIKLKFKTVPCVIADDLSEDQIKAFRIADNSSAQFAEWDFKLLNDEIKDIFTIDMDKFGISTDENKDLILFDNGKEKSIEEWGEKDEAEKSDVGGVEDEVEYRNLDKHENLDLRIFEGVGEFEIPRLEPCKLKDYKDCDFVPWSEFFNTSTKERRAELGVHFFVHDYRFDGVWRNIDKYIPLLLEHKYVVTPDWSTYTDFPKAVKVFNYYKNMWVGAYIQEKAKEMGSDVKVIPNLIYGGKNENWCFDGMPHGGVVAMSSVGMTQGDAWEDLLEFYDEMYNTLAPSAIIWFGKVPNNIPGNIIKKSAFIDKFQKEGDNDGKN